MGLGGVRFVGIGEFLQSGEQQKEGLVECGVMIYQKIVDAVE